MNKQLIYKGTSGTFDFITVSSVAYDPTINLNEEDVELYNLNEEDVEPTFALNPLRMNLFNEGVAFSFDVPEDFDTSVFVVTIPKYEVSALYIDDNTLMNAELEFLMNHCNDCLGKQQKERLILYHTKKALLNTATEMGDIEAAMGYYQDMLRLLDVKKGPKQCAPIVDRRACKRCVSETCYIC